MTVLHGNYLNASSVKVAARSNTSVVTANMSGTGRDEKQELIVNSTVIYEKQVSKIWLERDSTVWMVILSIWKKNSIIFFLNFHGRIQLKIHFCYQTLQLYFTHTVK